MIGDADTIVGLSWPLELLPEALQSKGHPLGHAVASAGGRADEADFTVPEQWIRAVASNAGLEAAGCEVPYGGLSEVLASRRLIVLVIKNDDGEARALLLQRSSRDTVRIFPPSADDGVLVSVRTVERALYRHAERPYAQEVHRMLEAVASLRKDAAYVSIMQSIVGAESVGSAWLLTPAQTHTGIRGLVQQARIGPRLARVATWHILQYAAFVAAWAELGSGLLVGQLDRGRFLLALLLFATSGLLTVVCTRAGFDADIAFGATLKRWLLAGALALDSDWARRFGAGQLVGLMLESKVVEYLALEGALAGGFAGLELMVAAWILLLTKAGHIPLVVLALLVLLGAGLMVRLSRRHRRWVESRTALTGETIEVIVGHRTRLVQSSPDRWHDIEAGLMENYRQASVAVDEAQWQLRSLASVWLASALLGLLPTVISGAAMFTQTLALGGILLAHRALQRGAAAAVSLIGAATAFSRLTPLLGETESAVATFPRVISPSKDVPLLEAHGIAYRYDGSTRSVLADCSLTIMPGDRVLLEAPSGAGKSTLAALLAGLRRPSEGVLLLCGLDLGGLGSDEWRRRVTLVPQFHENHVMLGTVAFNALMGRGWPASREDLADAERVLTELGLGAVLAAMPSGIEQAVGEVGWRLSHGERSRLFLARALLQNAEVIIADESFGALDPDTFRMCLRCVERYPGALVLLAHR